MKKRIIAGAFICTLATVVSICGAFFFPRPTAQTNPIVNGAWKAGFEYEFGEIDPTDTTNPNTGSIFLGLYQSWAESYFNLRTVQGSNYIPATDNKGRPIDEYGVVIEYDSDGNYVLIDYENGGESVLCDGGANQRYKLLFIERWGEEAWTTFQDNNFLNNRTLVEIPRKMTISDHYKYPLFSRDAMIDIKNGKPTDETGYGFVMLDDISSSQEFVMLEFLNLPRHGVATAVGNNVNTVTRWRRTYVDGTGIGRQTSWRVGGGQGTAESDILINQKNGIEFPNDRLREHAKENPNRLYANTNSLIGVFNDEGLYEFIINCEVPIAGGGATLPVEIKFNFYIVKKSDYVTYTPENLYSGKDDEIKPRTTDGQYYQGYGDGDAHIRYDAHHYDVSVFARDIRGLRMTDIKNYCISDSTIDTGHPGNGRRWLLNRLGNYTVSADIMYFQADVGSKNGKTVLGRYSTHNYALSIFGVEAYYENYGVKDSSDEQQIIFGGEKQNNIPVAANITSTITRSYVGEDDNVFYSLPFTGSDGGFYLFPTVVDGDPKDGVNNDWISNRIKWLNKENPNDPQGFKGEFILATTNTPPVELRGNVTGVKGRVFFNDSGVNVGANGTGISQWVEPWTFDISNAYTKIGEYFIILQYTYTTGEPYTQAFYFKIANGISPRVEVTNTTYVDSPAYGKTLTFYLNEYVGGYLQLAPFDEPAIYLCGLLGDHFGPYEIDPRDYDVYLMLYDWTVNPNERETGYKSRTKMTVSHSGEIVGLQKRPPNGLYVIQISYGNVMHSMMEYVIAVDTGTVLQNGLEIRSTGSTHGYVGGDNLGLKYFGAGEVTVNWKPKQSDRANVQSMFSNGEDIGKYESLAMVNFYPFVQNPKYFETDTAGNYYYFTQETNGLNNTLDYRIPINIQGAVYSPYVMSTIPQPQSYPVIQSADGDRRWYIYDNNYSERMKFTKGGLYIIEVKDKSGVKNVFAFIIDNTTAGFAQSEPCTGQEANIVARDEVTIGYGQYKVIEAPGIGQILRLAFDAPDYTALGSGNVIFPNIIAVSMQPRENVISEDQIEWVQTSGANWQFDYVTPSVPANGARSVTAKEEGFYFFRSTDFVGNRSTWYVWLNRDKSRGMVLEDYKSSIGGGMTESTNIVRPDGMATLNYLYFSFIPHSADTHVVEKVDLLYYPFDYTIKNGVPVSKMYPFAEKGVPSILFDYNKASAKEQASEDAISRSINPILSDNKTAPGLYMISRSYFYKGDEIYADDTVIGQYKKGEIMGYYEAGDLMENGEIAIGGEKIIAKGGEDIIKEAGEPMYDDFDRSDKIRNYFFIVDRNKVIPLESLRNFDSAVKIIFGGNPDKIADFTKFSNPMRSNMGASIILPQFKSKYGANTAFTIPFDKYDKDGNLTHYNVTNGVESKKDMTILKLNATAKINEGQFNKGNYINFTKSTDGTYLSDPDLNSQYTFDQSGNYELTLNDGSGGVSWMPFTFTTRENESNKSTIEFAVDKGHINAYWYVIDKESGYEEMVDYSRSSTQFNKNTQNLELRIENIGADFFADIVDDDKERNIATSFLFRNPGLVSFVQMSSIPDSNIEHYDISGNVTDIIVKGTDTPDGWIVKKQFVEGGEIISYNITQYITASKTDIDTKGASIIAFLNVQERGKPALPTPVERILVLDNTPPKYNIGEVRKRDALFKQKNDAIGAPDYPNYVYSVPNDFVFKYLDQYDTYHIEFREVSNDAKFTPITPSFTTISYGTVPFIRLPQVVLKVGKIQFFNIREYDEAGNVSSYYIKIRPDNYYDTISASGISVNGDGGKQANLIGRAVSNATQEGMVFGTDIRVIDVKDYWDNNPNFIWTYTIGVQTFEFKRYSYDASKRLTDFEDWLNGNKQKNITGMLPAGRGSENQGGTIVLKITDGYTSTNGTPNTRTITIYQVTNLTLPAKIQTGTAGTFGEHLEILMSNRADLDMMFKGITYTVKLHTIDASGRVDMLTPDIGKTADFNTDVRGTTAFGEGYGQKDVIVVVTDSFGRSTIIEHHAGEGLYKRITYAGTTITKNGIRYVGHKEGVTIEWNNKTYVMSLNGMNINVNDDEIVSKYSIRRLRGDIYTLNVVPFNKDLLGGDTTSWEVRFTFKISGTPAGDPERWQFYSVLPELSFRNINGTALSDSVLADLDNGIEGMVEVSLDRSGFLFSTQITYTVTYNGKTDYLPINRFATRFILDQPGLYLVTTTNEVSATKTYQLYIKEVDNMNYKIRIRATEQGRTVYKELAPSPKTFLFNGKKVPVYWFTGTDKADTQILSYASTTGNNQYTSSSKRIQVVPTLNHEFTLSVVYATESVQTWGGYYAIYVLTSKGTGVNTYFALAVIPESTLGLTTLERAPYENAKERRLWSWATVPGNGNTESFNDVGTEGIAYRINPVNIANDIRDTNVYYIEYAQNGITGGRAFDYLADIVRIEKPDYGDIRLTVRDWAGNERIFGQGQNLLPYYTVYNLSVPPILINGETALDEMVYNDILTVRARTDFPALGQTVDERDNYVTKMVISRNGEVVDTFEFSKPADKGSAPKHEPFQFSYNDTGRYTIECEYYARGKNTASSSMNSESSGYGSKTVKSVHTVQLINTSRFVQAFDFGGASNITFTNVTFAGRTNVTSKFENGLKITPANGDGRYRITFAVNKSNLRDGYTFTRDVYVCALNLNNSIVTPSKEFGGSYVGSLSITFNPIDVMRAVNNNSAELRIWRVYPNGYSEIDYVYNIKTNMTIMQGDKEVQWNINDDITHTVSGQGQYMIDIVSSVSDTTIFVGSFSLGQGANNAGLWIGVGIAVAFGIGALIFIRLRTGMRVK